MWCRRKHSWVPHTASPVWRITGGPGGGCQGHECQGHMCRVTGACKAPPGESFPSLSLETPRFVWMRPPRRLSGPVCAEPSASPGVPVTAAGSSVAQSSVEMEKGKPRGSSASSPWSSQVPRLRSVPPSNIQAPAQSKACRKHGSKCTHGIIFPRSGASFSLTPSKDG